MAIKLNFQTGMIMTEEISEQRQSRLNKLAKLEEMGYNPYPYRFKPDSFAKPLQEKYKELPAGENTEDRVTVAGRAMAVRNDGMFISSCFLVNVCFKSIPPIIHENNCVDGPYAYQRLSGIRLCPDTLLPSVC